MNLRDPKNLKLALRHAAIFTIATLPLLILPFAVISRFGGIGFPYELANFGWLVGSFVGAFLYFSIRGGDRLLSDDGILMSGFLYGAVAAAATGVLTGLVVLALARLHDSVYLRPSIWNPAQLVGLTTYTVVFSSVVVAKLRKNRDRH